MSDPKMRGGPWLVWVVIVGLVMWALILGGLLWLRMELLKGLLGA